ncbi:hypothetical protein HU200_045255 [Digitaria exilis]|uniref:Piwi domain-containing protein n=1 Tax=Digitaria exilis TaxID=1010633 RepID=A0A835B657_9POAL|nr:hypothetical protein HU200_045255 [Digitaria exilis]
MSTRGGGRGGGGGGRGGRGEYGGGRGGGRGRGRGRGAAELGGRGGGERGGGRFFHGAQPCGRGGQQQHYGVAAQGQGRWQVAAPSATAPAPTSAEVEVLSGELERRAVVVAEEAREPPVGQGARVEGGGTVSLESGQQEEAHQVVAAPPAGRLPPASGKALVFPARPGYGTIGRRCRVRANHFLVQAADREIYHYDVVITPESKSRVRNRWIVTELVELHKQFLDGRLPVYDGQKGLFTAGPLPFKTKEFVLKLTNPERANRGETEYKVTIKDAAKIDLYSLKQFLAGRQRELPQDTIQTLDVALRQCPSASYVSISRSFFSQAFGHGGEIGNGVECWRGYYQSLRPTQMGLSLNIDISATAFYKAQPIIDFALGYLNIRDTSRRLTDQDRIKVCNILEGQRYSRKLNERQVTSILRMACERPTQRESSILEVVNRNNYIHDPYAKEFGIKVTNQLALVDARVLPAPRLKYHDTGREKVCDPFIGQWNMNNKALQLLIIVLPDANATVFYGRAKRLCETELGVITQCCLPRNVQKGGQQYLQNLALKINVKVVASMDWPEVSKYRCLVSSQGHREEIIADLFTQVKDPQKGLVHGGMIRHVGKWESQTCKDNFLPACASLEEGYLPPVTFVVVQKRHHTRLFPEDHRARDQTDRSGNILPGTVVDTKICHPSEFDFYLCSHSGIQGTSRPTHYHVLFDENNFTADALQTLTYNLCYTYARCTRSVSIVPPAYYAHLAAFRARHYLDEGLSDQGSSSAASSQRHGHATIVKPLPKVKENVKQFMFYC